jgi:hypothetical protein
MTSKHTQGPWGVEQTDYTNWIGFMRPDGRKLELIVCTTDRDSLTTEALERNDANARLIAAAPELLELLERVAYHMEGGIRMEYPASPEESPQPASEWDHEADRLAGEARRLIAKATGGES